VTWSVCQAPMIALEPKQGVPPSHMPVVTLFVPTKVLGAGDDMQRRATPVGPLSAVEYLLGRHPVLLCAFATARKGRRPASCGAPAAWLRCCLHCSSARCIRAVSPKSVEMPPTHVLISDVVPSVSFCQNEILGSFKR
jgi:hypothetical protein